jgi:glycyl-tRNA synthetase
MDSFYEKNGLVLWNSRQIQLREMFRDYFAKQMEAALRAVNPMWQYHQIEAPLLTPRSVVNKNYTEADMFVTADDLVLRPETTPGSYRWTRAVFDDSSSGVRPPVCVWQVGKSFRREQDQVTKNMRLKEFYQQEFQCVFTSDTANDYHTVLQEPVKKMIQDMVGLPTRLVASDRLPDYSKSTVDVEVDNGDKWMEVCSMSLRTDFPGSVQFTAKGKAITKDLLVAEVAIGLDRCVYNFLERAK